MIANALHYQLDLPFVHPPLWGNDRAKHWGPRSAASKVVRNAVATLAKRAQIPASTHLDVVLSWAPGDRRRRDADNLWPMLKACCDGLARGPRKDWAGLDIVPDDTPKWMTKHAPVILSPDEHTGKPGMWLDIWAVPVAVEL